MRLSLNRTEIEIARDQAYKDVRDGKTGDTIATHPAAVAVQSEMLLEIASMRRAGATDSLILDALSQKMTVHIMPGEPVEDDSDLPQC